MFFFQHAQEQAKWHATARDETDTNTMASPTPTVLASPVATSLLSSLGSIGSRQSTRSMARTPLAEIPIPSHHQASTAPRELGLVTFPRAKPIQQTQLIGMQDNKFDMLVSILPPSCNTIFFSRNCDFNISFNFFQAAYQAIMTGMKDELLDK